MLIVLIKFRNWPPVVFVGGMILTGILEWGTGAFIMEVWHKRMWNYTGLFMNIEGYVCLRSVLTFAIGGVFLIYLIEPFLMKKIGAMKNRTVHIVTGTFFALMAVDLIHHIIITI